MNEPTAIPIEDNRPESLDRGDWKLINAAYKKLYETDAKFRNFVDRWHTMDNAQKGIRWQPLTPNPKQ